MTALFQSMSVSLMACSIQAQSCIRKCNPGNVLPGGFKGVQVNCIVLVADSSGLAGVLYSAGCAGLTACHECKMSRAHASGSFYVRRVVSLVV